MVPWSPKLFKYKVDAPGMGTGSAFEIIENEKHHTSTVKPQPQHHLNSPSNGKTWKKQEKQTSSTCRAFGSSAAPAARPRPRFNLKNTPPQTKTRKHHRNTAHTSSKVTPKSLTKVAKSGPKTVQGRASDTKKKLQNEFCVFGSPKTPKGSQQSPHNHKRTILEQLISIQKMFSQVLFFLDF